MRKIISLIFALLLVCLPTHAGSTKWMVGNESGMDRKTTAAYPLLQKANVEYVRLFINWPRVNPTPGVFDWDSTDREIDAILAAGLKVYANFGWAPRHASGGIPAYEEYTRGCTVMDGDTTVTFLIGDDHPEQIDRSEPLHPKWARRDVYRVPRGGTITLAAPGVLGNDGDYGKNVKGDPLASVVKTVTQPTPTAHGTFTLWHNGSLTYTHNGDDAKEDGFRYWVWGLGDGANGIHYAADDHEYCVNIPRIDPEKTRALVSAFVERYRDKVALYGMWNEPGLDLYWPPMYKLQDASFERYTEDLILPFVDTVRALDPSAQIVGPECDSSHCLRGILEQEKKAGKRWFDIVSFHPYPWTEDFNAVGGSTGELWAKAAAYRIDNDFKPTMDPYLVGRPVWATEVGPGFGEGYGLQSKQLAEKVLDRPWIKVLGFHVAPFWFQPGTVDDGTYVPNELYDYTSANPYTPPKPRQRSCCRFPIPRLPFPE